MDQLGGIVSLTVPNEKLAVEVYVTVHVPDEPATTSAAGAITAVPLPAWANTDTGKMTAAKRHRTAGSPLRALPAGPRAGLTGKTL